MLFVLLVVVKNAWLSEDSFISFRVVNNFVDGLGLRWNPLERVQVYTHPLWVLVLAPVYFISKQIYFAAMALSLVCSGAAIGRLIFHGFASLRQCLLVCTLLAFSKAFIDFSTGGLENPLSHLLIVSFFIEYLKRPQARKFARMVWFFGLAILNRMDLILLFLPALVHLSWQNGYWRARHWRLWVGLLPFALWETFALFYYGFLFPNSAYAKLTSGLPAIQIAGQGGAYFINSLSWDPLTLLTIVALLALGFFGHGDRALKMIATGVLLYLLYVVKVGGDYMTGRMFAAPLLASLFIISRLDLAEPLEFASLLGIALVVGWSSPRPPVQTNDQYVSLGSAPQWVDDERGYRHGDTSLLRLTRSRPLIHIGGWAADGMKAREDHVPVSVYNNIGYYGFFAGPDVHIIDPYGLGDPLMARMPFPGGDRSWSAGHFYRDVPVGYPMAAIDQGAIADPALNAYWLKLKLVTRGPIFDAERLAEVVRFNLGRNIVPVAR